MVAEEHDSNEDVGERERQNVHTSEQQLVGELRQLRAEQRSLEDKLLELQSHALGTGHKPNGAATAAVLSAAIGVFAIGLLTTLAAANVGIKNWLNWYDPTGPLSGKTTLGGIVWLVAWAVAHALLRKKETNFAGMLQVTAAFIVVGLLLMFPPIFELLE